MRGGLDRLQKEMDALTYNSRTVLNALIRSTVVNGSSQGFTVTRVNETITLSRVDIYRLYKFYQEWENNGFSTQDIESRVNEKSIKSFDTIRHEQDSLPVVNDNGIPISSATTDALVKHSKILFLNENNIDQLSISNFWLGVIKDTNNPKLISNSSPIPINLRTPVFDENLASTRYNQHPTYLFPNAYYILDAFGYAGDDTDHRMDGKSWTIGGDDFVNIESPSIALGNIDTRDIRKTSARRNGPDSRSNFSTTWGYNTHARGLYSSAGGNRSMVSEDATAAISIGNSNYSTNRDAATVGGRVNGGVGEYIGIMGGTNNTAIGNRGGILGGRNNIVGSEIHSFVFPSSNLDDESCVVSLDECATSIETSGGTVFGRNQIAIEGNVLDYYKVNDIVRLFRFTTQSNSTSGLDFYQLNGDIFDTQEVNVTAVEYVDPNTNPDNLNIGMTIISLSDDVTGVGIIDGGRISVKVNARRTTNFGLNSVALGAYSQAKGEDQTVLGHYNYIDVSSRFIVGTGTSDARGSGFNVTDTALFLSATPRNGDMRYGIDGYYGMEITQNVLRASAGNTSWNLYPTQTFIGHNYESAGRYGVTVNDNSASNRNVIISGSDNGIIIQSNPFPKISPTLITQDIGIVSDNRIKSFSVSSNEFWSRDSYISVNAGTDVRVNWGGNLILSGNTFGALPTTDKQYAFRVNGSNVTSFAVGGSSSEPAIVKTGFYHLDGDLHPLNSNPDAGNTGTDNSIMNTVMSTQDDNGNIEGWELFSTTYSSDALKGFGRIYVNKFNVLQDGLYRTHGAKPLAWWDDVKDWGIWHDLVPITGDFGVSHLYIGDGPVYNSGDDKSEIRNIIKHLTYTIIQNTVHVKMRINFKAVDDAWTGYKSTSNQTIRVELNPSVFTRSFSGDGISPGAVDVANFDSNFVMTARLNAQRTITVIPRGSVDGSTNLDFRSTFSITDELRPLEGI